MFPGLLWLIARQTFVQLQVAGKFVANLQAQLFRREDRRMRAVLHNESFHAIKCGYGQAEAQAAVG